MLHEDLQLLLLAVVRSALSDYCSDMCLSLASDSALSRATNIILFYYKNYYVRVDVGKGTLSQRK